MNLRRGKIDAGEALQTPALETAPDSPDSRLPLLTPDSTLQAPDWAELPHARPFVCRLTPPHCSASRSIPHVSNIEYLRWVDRAAELHARALGMAREDLLARNRMWFVARHELDYLAECWPGQRLAIATWIESVGRAASWRATVVWRDEDRRVVFRSRSNWVFVDILSRRPVRIEAAMREALLAEAAMTERRALRLQ